MGQAKMKQRDAFAQSLVEEWESRDCIDFAFALARMTNWLLHVDWWTPSITGKPPEGKEDGFIPLRVYVADNKDLIFDPRGVMPIFDFAERIVIKQVRARAQSNGGVLTRFYGEEKFASLPVRFQPDENRIAEAIVQIQKYPTYLSRIPERSGAQIPAHHAARFSFGRCAVFAEALREHAKLQPTALLAVRILPGWKGTEMNERGYFHSVVLHRNGMAQDSWGIAPLHDIALRFGVSEFITDADEHRSVVSRLQTNSPEAYAESYSDAMTLLKTHGERCL